MAQRDQEKSRKRPIILQGRFSKDEAALIREQAARASVSVSALMRYALLDQTPLRASRQPKIDAAEMADFTHALGQFAQALRDHNDRDGVSEETKAMQHDIADMRVALFEALGRQP